MNDLWYVAYEPKIMLVDTVGMRPDTELAHRRLCDVIWATGEAPMDDDEILPDICRVKEVDWVRIKGELKAKGWIVEAGRFLHRGAQGLVNASLEKAAKLSAAGRAGAKARHGKTVSETAPAQPTAEPTAQPAHCDRTATAQRSAVRPDCHLESESKSESKEEGSDKVSKPCTEGGPGGEVQTPNAKRQTPSGRALRGRLADIAALCEAVLNGEWINDAGKWVERIRAEPERVWRVMVDVKAAKAEGRIKTTAARMAEYTWGIFK